MEMLFLISLIAILSTGQVWCKRETTATFGFASYYGDHMVLQKAPQQAVVWGYSDSVGSGISVTLSGYPDSSTTVFANKTWSVKLPVVSDNKAHTITAKSGNLTTTISDVLFGDVWLCSGESNMRFTLDMGNNATAEMQDAKNFPNIRLFTAAQQTSDTPLIDLTNVEEKWSLPSEDTTGHQKWTYFSALCWLYGKRLYKERKYPIGLITSAYEDTGIEMWSSPDVLTHCGVKEDPLRMALPPSSTWNAMIVPLTRMTIYGVLWYQGESNVNNPNKYNCTFPYMIKNWRKHFNINSGGQTDGTFPFGFVQLAPNGTGNTNSGFADIRWHQTADIGHVPNYYMDKVFMAVAMDLPDTDSPFGSIHPRYKQDIANRLLMSGLAVAYNKLTNVRYQGPIPDGYSINLETKTIRIGYDNRSTHLSVRSMDGFEVCCSSNNRSMCNDKTSKWMPAPIVEYDAYSVQVWYEACDKNDFVVGLRYEWKETPCTYGRCAIYSKENGLPAAPLITLGNFGNKKYDRTRTRKKVIY